jgi:hypothetical protein
MDVPVYRARLENRNGDEMHIQIWTQEIIEDLKASFGDRLLFAGLQGSHVRGEATPESDIDLVVILDKLEIEDLVLYRSLIDAKPNADKACGFISGRDELKNWPKHELLQFKMETVAYHGSLDALLPELCKEDILAGVRAGAAGLYHAACHSYVHANADDYEGVLRQLYKASFFVLQAQCYYESGEYYTKKADLRDALTGDARRIMEQVICRAEGAKAEELFAMLIKYSRSILNA